MSKTSSTNQRKKFFSMRKKIFLSIFSVSFLFCIMGAVDQIFLFGDTITYIGLVVILAIAFTIALIISSTITRPIKKVRWTLNELRLGHIHERCNVQSNDEIGMIADDLDAFASNFDNVVIGTFKRIADGDVSMAIEAHDKKDIVAATLKSTVDTVNSIINEASGVVESANEGVLTKRCNDTKYKGSWKTLTQAINALCDNVSAPIEEVMGVINKISVNDYTVKVSGQYKGAFKNLADDVNKVLDGLLNIQNISLKFSKGDTSPLENLEKVGRLSENDNMIPALTAMMHNIENLIKEVEHLSAEAVSGNVLIARGDASKFEGGYKKIIEGFNRTLETVSEPLSEVMNVLGKMSVNDFTIKCEENYNGDFEKLVKAVNKMQRNMLIMQHVAIKVSNGDISDLEAVKAGMLSENDELVPAFTLMMENIKSLIDETTQIASYAAQGKLDVRGDATKFKGGYASIINSINEMLVAIETPIDEVTSLMVELNKTGNLELSVSGEYEGAFKLLSDSVNTGLASMNKVIQMVSNAITEMSKGNFSISKTPNFPGSYESISIATNAILDSLNELFSNVSETAAQVAAGSAQVSQGSQLLSQGATEQASSVEELSASITEVASQTRQNAMNASKASTLVSNVKSNATSGTGQMGEMLKAMSEISESSTKIANVIKVIDDIAFQTNILALNAAVEAARAGQAGKGFAVVADEVRNLAAKSASAASDTTALIESTVSKVKSGTVIASDTAKAFEGIVSGVDNVVKLVSEIAVSSNEQATGIAQINQGLDQVSKVIQTNSATSEESAAASEELSSQAVALSDQVSKFTLRGKGKASETTEKSVRLTSGISRAESAITASTSSHKDGFGKY